MKTNPSIRIKSLPHPFRGKKSLALAALLLVPAASVLAQSFWNGGTSDYNVAGSWLTNGVAAGVPTGSVNAANDSGSANVVLIQPGDPVWQHGDTIAGQTPGSSGAYLQTGSTNNTGGGNWLRLAVGTNGTVGYYTLSNGVINVGGETHIGEHGTATLEIDGGTFNGGVNGGNPGLCMGDADWSGGSVLPSDNNPTGTLIMNGGTINTTHEMWFGEANSGRQGTGHFIMHGGTINANNWFVFGRFGGLGDGYMDGGTINKSANGNWQMAVGTTGGTLGAQVTFTQVGGVINCLSEYQISTDNNLAWCTNNIGSNAVLNVGNWFAVGRFGGMGTLNISGNAAITKSGVTGGNLTIASGSSIGVINQNGGTFTNTATQSWISENGTGLWNLNSGAAVLGVVRLTQNASANGTFNLNGGNLTASEIYDNNTGIGILNLNGGTLHVGAPTANPWIHGINGGLNLLAGGATIDTAGNNATITQALNDGGSGGTLTITGGGTLTMSGANFYSGPTVVSAGTLVTTPASSALGTYSVADNAGLGVTLTGANTQFSPATVTLGTSLGATNSFDLGGFGNPTLAPLNVTGNLAVNGTIVVNIADTLPQLGQFPLIKYGTKSGAGTFTVGALPNGVVASIVNNTVNNSIDLNITSVALDLWNGLAGGNWDINVTTNWSNAGTGLPTTYLDGVSVVFNDTALGTTLVNLVTNVQPRTITILNNASNYTLVGTGQINGAIGLNKGGAAAFAIYNANGYTGPTVLSGGTLLVTNLANGGALSAIGTSSASPTNLVLAGGALSYAGAPLTINRGYNLQFDYNSNGVALNNALDMQGNLTLTGPATAASGSSFVKSGPGTLTYAGAVTNALSGGAFPGYQIINGTVVFNGSAGAQLNTNANEFWVGSSTSSPAPANLILTNTTLNVQSWIALGRGNGTSNYLTTMRMDNSTVHAGNFSMGYWANLAGNYQQSTLTMNNSKFYDTGAFNIGESAGSTATIYLNGNSVFNENGPFLCGLQAGATGIVVMANSTIVTNNLWLSVGANGYGTLVMSNNAFLAEGSDFNFGDYGGTTTVGNFFIQDNAQVVLTGTGNGVYVGKSAGAVGNVVQTGGTVNARSAGAFQLGQAVSTVGTWLQSGGTNFAGGWTSIGRGYTAGDLSPSGFLWVSGGLFDQTSPGNGLIVGEQGTGTLTITNTGLVISEATNIGVAIGWNGGYGTLNLDGGTLVANFIQGGTGSSTINFNGGLLRAGAATRLNFMTNISSAFILAGANIDTGNNTLDIYTALQNTGSGAGLTKTGSGTLLLDGANSYLGATTISAGTLGGSGSLAGPAVIAAGAALAPGDSAIGTLTVNSTLNLAGTSTTVMELNKTTGTNDLVTGVTTLTYGGTLVLKNLSGTLAPGDTFTLFTSGAYSGSFSSVSSQTPGQTVTWDVSQLAVNGTVKVATAVAAPVMLTSAVSGGNLNLSWPANQIGWELQEQSNPLTIGLSTNWVAVPGSTTTNQVSLPVDTTEPSEFFRLVFPQQ